MVSYETSTIVYVTLQILNILVFAVGAILAMTGRVQPGQRGLFGVGCGLNVLGTLVFFLVYLPSGYIDDTVLYIVVTVTGSLITLAGVVLIVIGACRRPGPPAYPYPHPYAAAPGQQYGYPPPWGGAAGPPYGGPQP